MVREMKIINKARFISIRFIATKMVEIKCCQDCEQRRSNMQYWSHCILLQPSWKTMLRTHRPCKTKITL